MKKMLLLVFILSAGLSALSADMVRQYHYVQESKTWTEAQTYCRERFHDLAIVNNHEENQRLLSVLKSNGKYAWIGISAGLKVWRWLLGNVHLNNSFSNWAEEQPTIDYKKNCGLMTKQGLWYSSNCWRKHPVACYYEQGPSKYILVNKEMNAHEARTYCRTNYTDLVSVRSESENGNVSSLLSEDTWIGLRGRFWNSWSDQTYRSFGNWNRGQPNRSDPTTSCAAVNTTTGKWWDVHCEKRNHFICHNGSEHKTALKLKFQSTADLSDPAVQQQILEQLHAELEKHDLPDFKLRWKQTDGQIFHKQQKRNKDKGSGG